MPGFNASKSSLRALPLVVRILVNKSYFVEKPQVLSLKYLLSDSKRSYSIAPNMKEKSILLHRTTSSSFSPHLTSPRFNRNPGCSKPSLIPQVSPYLLCNHPQTYLFTCFSKQPHKPLLEENPTSSSRSPLTASSSASFFPPEGLIPTSSHTHTTHITSFPYPETSSSSSSTLS